MTETAVAEGNVLDMELDEAYAERDDLLAEIRQLVEDRKPKPR